MKKYKKKAANVLLVVFSAIILSAVFQAQNLQAEETEEIVVIHKNERSGEAPGNVSRSFVDHNGYENRTFQVFTFQTLEEFHTQKSFTIYTRVNLKLVQFNAPVKVYKLVQSFLI